jgi:hypothetical protein
LYQKQSVLTFWKIGNEREFPEFEARKKEQVLRNGPADFEGSNGVAHRPRLT